MSRRKKRDRSVVTRARHKKPKTHIVIGTNGDPCPRCGRPTETRAHAKIEERHLRQPFYYSQWFYCVNGQCRTTLIMPERFKVFAGKKIGKLPADDTRPLTRTEFIAMYGEPGNTDWITNFDEDSPPWE